MSRAPRRKPKLLRSCNAMGVTLLGDAMTAALVAARRIEAMNVRRRPAASNYSGGKTILLVADDDGRLHATRADSELAQEIAHHFPRWPIGYYIAGARAREIAEDIAHEARLRGRRMSAPSRKSL